MNETTPPTAAAGSGEPGMAVVRHFYDAVAQGDVDAVLDLLDPQVEWRAPESLPWGGTFRGHNGIREFLAKVADQPAEFRREVREYLDAGDRIVVPVRLFVRPSDGDPELEVAEIHVWTVRDSKLVDLEAIFDTATVLRAMKLQPTAPKTE
jgi:ketosteroid isomerase-like protein